MPPQVQVRQSTGYRVIMHGRLIDLGEIEHVLFRFHSFFSVISLGRRRPAIISGRPDSLFPRRVNINNNNRCVYPCPLHLTIPISTLLLPRNPCVYPSLPPPGSRFPTTAPDPFPTGEAPGVFCVCEFEYAKLRMWMNKSSMFEAICGHFYASFVIEG